ncbi:thioredoxin domain-containing protein [Flavobacterium psychrotolerans]|uniref:Vitamin K epoxide reductase domain-containing protein n=1 Tax=Flavobacterium psychrotolerans TaxID=2169410 RepID=A0A2U1JJU0_9FLAO|nr:thioredoxin domain-containing protein [Flavobacterium psychrotolerans]PWA05411.1 hypothetical protein DB895_07390 [Flavobacterium psychrotolerans]
MNENFNYLFYYLEKENIAIDKFEFLFQIQSHPDYPSILSISDSLNFFNIENGAIHISVSEIELLPDRFVALLKEDNDKPRLYFVDRKSDKYFFTKDKKTSEISKVSLESRWQGIVLLVEKSVLEEAKSKINKLSWVLPLLCLGIFLVMLFQFETSLLTKLFFVFPVVGFLFSFAALKDLFGAKSELINNFCNITASTSCTTIVDSDKWKIFKFVNFSDLSIVFFASQFFTLLLFIVSGDSAMFFCIQEILIFCALPIIFLSLYFQKFVEKKWCPICLVIITVLLLEIVYLVLSINLNFDISFKPVVLYGFVFLFTALVWSLLKNTLTEQKDLKEFQLKANRFVRNYEIFKNTLLSKEKIELPIVSIVLGNPESKTVLTLITNPFCGHCKNIDEIIEKILEKYNQDIQVKIVIKADLDFENEERKAFFRNLMSIYFEKGESVFKEALKDWFNNKDVANWLQKYQTTNLNNMKIDAVYSNHNNWCTTNDFNYTPAVFINGYEYPKNYERENLEFFVNELIEDNNF